MFGKVLVALGATLYVMVMMGLGLWWMTDPGRPSGWEGFADWRWITLMVMCIGGWCLAHILQEIFEEEEAKKKGEQSK